MWRPRYCSTTQSSGRRPCREPSGLCVSGCHPSGSGSTNNRSTSSSMLLLLPRSRSARSRSCCSAYARCSALGTRRVVATVRSIVAAQRSCTSSALRSMSANSGSASHDDHTRVSSALGTFLRPVSRKLASTCAASPPSGSNDSSHATRPSSSFLLPVFDGGRCSARSISRCISFWMRTSAPAAFSMRSACSAASRT